MKKIQKKLWADVIVYGVGSRLITLGRLTYSAGCDSAVNMVQKYRKGDVATEKKRFTANDRTKSVRV